MGAALVFRRALGRVFRAYGNRVVIDMSIVKMMQVTIVQVVGMAIVPDGRMSASLSVNVTVILVFYARSCHNTLP
jgi:hypothetical protein